MGESNNQGAQQQNNEPNNQNQAAQQQSGQGRQTEISIDYDKIQKMLDGTLAAKEDTALKAYFKQQGLSQQEAEQAMAAFKEQKAANQPNMQAVQQQANDALVQAQTAFIERDAMLLSEELGIDLKTVSYVLKMADTSQVIDENGGINRERLKEALNKVLEDLPQLKHQTDIKQSGFRQIGAAQSTGQQTGAGMQPAQKATPTKRWNRFNN